MDQEKNNTNESEYNEDDVQEIHINKQYDDEHYEEEDSEPIFIREKSDVDYSRWFWILGILFFLILIGFGYSKGWFDARQKNTEPVDQSNTSSLNQDAKPFSGVPENPAPIDSAEINTLESFPVRKVLVLKGTFGNGCGYLADPVQERDGNVFIVTLETIPVEEGAICTQALVPFERQIDLMVNNLPAGKYFVRVNGTFDLEFELEGDNGIDFQAGQDK